MTDLMWFGILYLILLLAAVGAHALLFDRKPNYEWRKNMAAREAWKKIMEEKP